MTRPLIDNVILKSFSGRFLFTLVAAGVFAYLSVKGILPVDKVHEILLIVIYGYFTKERIRENKGGNSNG